MSATIWAPNGSTSVITVAADIAAQTFTATSLQTLFTLTSFSYAVGTQSLLVFKNGLLLPSSSYTETSSTSFTLTTGATLSDTIIAYGLTGGVGSGVRWLGAYAAGTTYIVGDVVSYLGSSYICILQSVGNSPVSATYWSLLASKGDAGATGAGTGNMLAANNLSELTATASTARTNIGAAAITSPTLVTPVLGVASATSLNKITFTAPATSAIFTLADGKTLVVSNSLTFIGTDSATITLGAGGTVAYKDKVGTFIKAQSVTPTALTSSAASIAWGISDSNIFTHTLTENTTLAAPTGTLVAGTTYIFSFTQHASAAKTLAFNSVFKFPGGIAGVISTTLSAKDILSCLCIDGTNLLCQFSKGYA